MNRRTALTTALASVLVQPAVASEPSNSDALRALINEVIRDGDMSNLDAIVTDTVEIPVMAVSGVDEFRHASEHGYDARQSEYASLAFDIVSVTEGAEWAHAMVRTDGEFRDGGKEARYLFYVAQFTDGLISRLYFG